MGATGRPPPCISPPRSILRGYAPRRVIPRAFETLHERAIEAKTTVRAVSRRRSSRWMALSCHAVSCCTRVSRTMIEDTRAAGSCRTRRTRTRTRVGSGYSPPVSFSGEIGPVGRTGAFGEGDLDDGFRSSRQSWAASGEVLVVQGRLDARSGSRRFAATIATPARSGQGARVFESARGRGGVCVSAAPRVGPVCGFLRRVGGELRPSSAG